MCCVFVVGVITFDVWYVMCVLSVLCDICCCSLVVCLICLGMMCGDCVGGMCVGYVYVIVCCMICGVYYLCWFVFCV